MKAFVTVSRGQRLNLFQRIQHGNGPCPSLDLFHITDFTQVYFRIQMCKYYIFMSGVLRIQENEFMRLYLRLSTITLSPQVKQTLKPMQTYREKCIHCMISFIYHTKIVNTNLWYQSSRQWYPQGGSGAECGRNLKPWPSYIMY